MIRTVLRLAEILLLSSVLGACGGGSSRVASIPTPPQSLVQPQPSVQPQPPGQDSTAGFLSGGIESGNEASLASYCSVCIWLTSPARNAQTIAYDATSGTYRLSGIHVVDELQPAVFGPGNEIAGNEPHNFRSFGSGPDHLTVLIDSPSNSRIVLNHLSYALWSHELNHPAEGATELVAGYILFGTETVASDMPRTGSATYQGIVDGFERNKRLLGSTGSLTADFSLGSLTTTLSLRETARLDGTALPVIELGTLTGTGSIGSSSSQFSGTLSGNLGGNPSAGSFLGSFYGPGAIEAGYAFTASGGPLDPLVSGLFVGKR